MITLTINGKTQQVDVDPNTPLLWVIREQVGLTGTKYGCGLAQCGACTVHIDGAAVRSCVMPVSAVAGKRITTIEGLAQGGRLHKVQKAWVDLDVPAVRLLPERHDHGGRRAPAREAAPDRRRHRRRDHQHLPLRHLPAGARGDPRRGQGSVRETTMTRRNSRCRKSAAAPSSSAAPPSAAASRSDCAFRPSARRWCARPDGSPEITVWVVIRPDNTTVVRVVRAEMGQGTITGLAQLVAEELECDWNKVVIEYPTPGQSVARKRVWGEFSTGGSRGIRQSHEYVRKGGAAARMMLVKAAADEWKVPASECTAANSVITHKPVGTEDDVRPGGRGRRAPRAAEGRAAQGSEDLEDRRQAGEAARHRGEGQRHDDLRLRPEAAGDAERRDQGLPGVRRQGEELRRRQGQRHEGRAGRWCGSAIPRSR